MIRRPPKKPTGPIRVDMPVRDLKGVGPKVEKALRKRGILSAEDLLYLLPLRYEDRRRVQRISDLVEGRDNCLLGRVVEVRSAYSRAKRRRLCSVVLDDGTGTLTVTWFRFHKRWMADVCAKDNMLLVSGKVGRFGAALQMIHPRVVVLKEGADPADRIRPVIPVYPEVNGVTQGVLRNIIEEALSRLSPEALTVIPQRVAEAHGLGTLVEAFRMCHSPDDGPPDEPSRRSARRRIVLEEFFLFQLAVLTKRRMLRQTKGVPMQPGSRYRVVKASLPFTLTSGQARVLEEIRQDMTLAEPMNRLLQGDVGSGKTICAILAVSVAADNGYQTAFLAPTEILADQHYLSAGPLLEEAGISTVLLTGGTGSERKAILERIERGETMAVFGTHAILQSDVIFHRLGLAIIDEQHRFGVIQRSDLKQKGANPHVLVMSATPIPRSLSMVIYGDLDLSVIDDGPGGKRVVDTRVITNEDWKIAQDAILEETGKGRQVFFVCPLVEESEDAGLRGAKKSRIRLQNLFPSLRIGLMHGRMKTTEKQEIMHSFRGRSLDVLVCTTVVEVGIDVPNATLIVIEYAERFGLAQLHQLRGRIGRGMYPSRCLLVSASARTAAATRRLKTLERTNDGFAIAEEDMKLRGVGDMIGVRQAGIPDLRIGDILKDGLYMGEARRIAIETMAAASDDERSALEKLVSKKWGGRLALSDVL
jgi:ATP-dependent DNA helicase RecG